MFDRNSRWYKRTRLGFTLLELIAVSTAIAILAATGIVTYRSIITCGQERATLERICTLCGPYHRRP
jgi:prepilin-type N-terminal cleavage/methylation domain-containing protein